VRRYGFPGSPTPAHEDIVIAEKVRDLLNR
jgi:hypothetical protein